MFPLSYDLTGLAIGHPSVIRASIPAVRPAQLAAEEEFALIAEADESDLPH